MSEEWLVGDLSGLSDWAFMKVYSHPYHHIPALKAKLDQEALGGGYGPKPRGGEAEKVAAERDHRGASGGG